MPNALRFLAGPAAHRRIKRDGLSPADVTALYGASGAAKWLTICGLDRALFESWLPRAPGPVALLGTSIGAWKLAAAARRAPGEALTRLAEAYIAQRYPRGSGPGDVLRESLRIQQEYLGAGSEAAAEILGHPRLRLHVGTVRCRGWLAAEDPIRLGAAVGGLALCNLGGRQQLRHAMERIFFSDPRDAARIAPRDRFPSRHVPLTGENLRPALLASGSIPLVMPAVEAIPGAPPGRYRDGGLLDYHPVPSLLGVTRGVVLYPHFYGEVTPGWFDKRYRRRRARGADLADVLLLCPSPSYVARLPHGRIPDRKDFRRFQGADDERMRVWRQAVAESERLGDAFLETVERGLLPERLEPIP